MRYQDPECKGCPYEGRGWECHGDACTLHDLRTEVAALKAENKLLKETLQRSTDFNKAVSADLDIIMRRMAT